MCMGVRPAWMCVQRSSKREHRKQKRLSESPELEFEFSVRAGKAPNCEAISGSFFKALVLLNRTKSRTCEQPSFPIVSPGYKPAVSQNLLRARLLGHTMPWVLPYEFRALYRAQVSSFLSLQRVIHAACSLYPLPRMLR